MHRRDRRPWSAIEPFHLQWSAIWPFQRQCSARFAALVRDLAVSAAVFRDIGSIGPRSGRFSYNVPRSGRFSWNDPALRSTRSRSLGWAWPAPSLLCLPRAGGHGEEAKFCPKIFWRLLLSLTDYGLGLFDATVALFWCCYCTDSFAAVAGWPSGLICGRWRGPLDLCVALLWCCNCTEPPGAGGGWRRAAWAPRDPFSQLPGTLFPSLGTETIAVAMQE